jgi:DNA-binding YbaB/EbfC family protein
MNKLLQQAQQMQKKMSELQDELKDMTVDAESGGGMVKVTFNGRQELVALHIDPQVVRPDEVDLLEDLLMAAMQEGQKKAGELAQSQMSKLTGGLPFPGMP